MAGCGDDKNGNSPEEDPQVDSSSEIDNEPLQNVRVETFIDVSKGMSGYYAGDSPTRFKTVVWDVLKKLEGKWNTDSIMLLSEKNPHLVDITSFRDNMNAGKLLYDNNTSIPQMLEDMVAHVDTVDGLVAVLISDMKYSPSDKKSPLALKAQYATDISSIFANKNLAVSLVCAVSEYKTKSRSCDNSPYYYLIVGNPLLVPVVRNEIVNALRNSDTFIGEVEKGVDYGEKLIASHNKARGIIPLDKEKLVYGGYNRKVTDTIAITLDVDLSMYPHFLRNSEVLKNHLSVETSGLAQSTISDVETSDNKASITIKIYRFKEKKQSITLTLGGFDPSLPREIEQYYGSDEENDCDKTISIEQFIRGIADQRNIQSTVIITITTED